MNSLSKHLQFISISKNIICSPNDKVKDILYRFDYTHGRPLIVLSNNDLLFGILSSGDIRSFITNRIASLEESYVHEVCNKNPVFVRESDSNTVIERLLSNNITLIPVLNLNRQVISCVFNEYPSIIIGDKVISTNKHYVYLIAEIGVNHNGSFEEAIYLIDQAVNAGFDAIKLQIRSDTTYSSDSYESKELSVQYIENEINRTKLNWNIYEKLIKYIKQHEKDVICTPFDEQSLDFIITLNVDAIKIASCDLTNDPLVIKAGKTEKPIIISTGMSSESEIIHANNLLIRHGNHAFLHCNSTYPAPHEDVNLAYISRLSELSNCVTGYSSHDGNMFIPYAAIGFGARIIESHITRSKDQLGTDHLASIEVRYLPEFVKSIRIISESIGDDLPRVPSQGEMLNRISLGKSLCYLKDLKSGHSINNTDLSLRSPAIGYKYSDMNEIMGKVLTCNVKEGQILMPDHIYSSQINDISFPNLGISNLIPGIPVRYHDINHLDSKFNLPLYEFHMSANDLRLSPQDFLNLKTFKSKILIVHSVEQYDDGFILDLASNNEHHVNESIKRVIALFKHVDLLRQFFSNSQSVPIIINCGGHTQTKPLTAKDANQKTIKIGKIMKELQADYPFTQLLAQTMPPFPWHQGGRSFHNCLTSISSIYHYLDSSGLDICLDISHTALAANHLDFDFYQAITDLIDQTGHLHIADASKSNQEGQQIGDGILDFHQILKIYANQNKTYTFIPEVWQGHLNHGEGFHQALSFIEESIKNII